MTTKFDENDNPTSVTLNVSREGVIASMRDTFTSQDIFIQELMQNALRAGATRLDITFQQKSDSPEKSPAYDLITFEDDGKGIGPSEIKALLTLGESDWTDEVTAEAQPYGLGFASAVFASTTVLIDSNQLNCLFDTAPVLKGEPIFVEYQPRRATGTKICLALNDGVIDTRFRASSLESVHDLVEKKSRAFPIPVVFNGEPVSRDLALEYNCKTFADGSPCQFETEVGTVQLNDSTVNSVHHSSTHHDQVLQGFVVGGSSSDSRHRVYLDGAQFKARMPDRSQMLNYDGTRVQGIIKYCLIKRAEWLVANKSQAELVSLYWRFLVEVLPAAVAKLPVPGRELSIPLEFNYFSYPGQPLSDTIQSETLGGSYFTHPTPILDLDDGDTDSATLLQHYAAMLLEMPVASNRLLCVPNPLSPNVWQMTDVEVVAEDEGIKRLYVRGVSGETLTVILCNSYTLRVTLAQEAESGEDVEEVFSEVINDSVIWTDDDLLIIPLNVSPGEAHAIITYLENVSMFDEAENFQDVVHDDLCGKLTDAVNLNRGGCVATALRLELQQVVKRLSEAGGTGVFNFVLNLDSKLAFQPEQEPS